MKKYCFNKNFIPKGFIERKRNKDNNRNRRSIFLLLLCAIFLMPNTIVFINKSFSCKDENIIPQEKRAKKNICSNESFLGWMDIIKDDTVGTFNNVDATIYVNSMDRFYEILKNKNIEVRSVEKCDDEKIEVQISKYTKE